MTSDSKPARVPGWLMLVGAMTAIGPFSIDMYLPGFPAIELEFAEQGVERTMASYLVGITAGQLIYGPISDRFGRKPPLYCGFVLYVIGALGCALAANMSLLIAMRVLQALGACAGMVIGRAIVRDRCQPHEAARAFAILMAIVSLGPIVAPMLGGWVVTAVGWRGAFVCQALLGVVLLVMMHRLLNESLAPSAALPLHPGQVARRYMRLLRDPTLVGYSLVGGFGMAALFCYVTGSPTVMAGTYGLSPQQFGWMLGLNGFAFMAASRLNLLALRKRTPDQALSSAIVWPVLIGAALTLAAVLLQLPIWATIVVQFLFFISVARTTPHAGALALAPHGREAGAASALMGSLQSLTATLAGVAVAIFNDGSLATLAMMMTVAVMLAAASLLWVRRKAMA